MKNNLHSIFSGSFYINKEYAQSLVPVIYSALIQNNVSSKTEAEKKSESVTLNAVSETSGNIATKVVVLSIKQPILKFSTWDFLGSKSFMSILDLYKSDPTVAGVVLDIDSGGGQVYGTPEFYDYIRAFPKPMVTYTDGYLCSAAYYLADATSYIVANKRADAIGSIGAYTEIVDFNGLWEKYGAKIHTIYATKSNEKNSEHRAVLAGDYQPYITNCLDPLVETFHQDMLDVRPGLNKIVFAGGTWNAEKSLSYGLIDEIGTIQTAIDKVISLSNINSNLNTMQTKNFQKVQAVLGLEAPLAQTDNGSFLNEDQLELLENRIDALELSEAGLTTALEEAKNNTDLQTTVTTLNDTVTGIEASVDAMLTEAGLTVTGTVTEKLTALSGKVTEMATAPGANHTTIRKGVQEATENNFVDPNASHNQLANSINN